MVFFNKARAHARIIVSEKGKRREIQTKIKKNV